MDEGTRGGGRLRRALLVASAGLSLVVALGAGAGAGVFLWAERQFVEVESAIDERTGEPIIGGPCVRRACTYLLLGSDSRAGLSREEQQRFGTDEAIGGEARSDTIILVQVDPRRERAVILHFPRDLWVRIPGHGWGKINTAFAGGLRGGGPDLVARTVERLTGLAVNHFLYVNLAGFEGVVDALGGVPICVDRPMEDPLAGLSIPRAGCYQLGGSEALAFVRARHVVSDGVPIDCIPDFSRIQRQQQFLRAVISELLRPARIADLPRLVPAVARNLVKDTGLKLLDVVALARRLSSAGAGAADFRVVPGVPENIYVDGVYTSIVRMAPEARELFRRLREGKPLGELGRDLVLTPPSPATIRVGVVDAGGTGVARRVLSRLGRGGFDTSPGLLDPSQLGLAVEGSAILFHRGAREEADVAAGFLPGLEPVEVPRRALPGLDVAVVLGADYEPTRPGPPPASPCG